jgi:hypothetical protein
VSGLTFKCATTKIRITAERCVAPNWGDPQQCQLGEILAAAFEIKEAQRENDRRTFMTVSNIRQCHIFSRRKAEQVPQIIKRLFFKHLYTHTPTKCTILVQYIHLPLLGQPQYWKLYQNGTWDPLYGFYIKWTQIIILKMMNILSR